MMAEHDSSGPASTVERDNEPSADLRRKVSLKIAITTRQLRRHFDQMVAELGVTRSQWTVIAAVGQAPGETQRRLAEELEMSEASAGRLVDRLCSDGLLLRRPKDEDRRAHCVYLTPAGEALIADLAKVAASQETVAFAGLDAEDLGRFVDVFDRILGNLGRPTRAAVRADKGRRRRPKEPPA